MNCQEYDAQIGDYVDGTLDADTRAAFDAHLSSCGGCREVVSDLQVIRAASLALEPQLPPPHLWRKISAAVEAEPRSLWEAFPGGQWLRHGLAAAATFTLVASLSWMGGQLVPIVNERDRLAAVATTPGAEAAASVATEYQDAEQHLATAIEGLERIAAVDRSQLDMETRDVLQANLTVLDGAIGESRAALAKEPENDVAQESLFEALRHKVALLQDTIALINEMRKGNPEGAARIVSGRNQ